MHYLLLITLADIDDPFITRTLSVSSRLTFAKLHTAIQIAFGWADGHAHKFTVSKMRSQGERNWAPFDDLLRSREPDTPFFRPDPGDPDAGKRVKTKDRTLADVFGKEEWRGKIFVSYEYDFGDGWVHNILFLGKTDPNVPRLLGFSEKAPVVCVAGEGHPCAEDCGGPDGWGDIKAAFRTGNDPNNVRDWYKGTCANGDEEDLDPSKWDILEVNKLLARKIRK
ncbi:hypothetical protein VTN02DRAFT_1037 [Thermoascus thermophilus]